MLFGTELDGAASQWQDLPESDQAKARSPRERALRLQSSAKVAYEKQGYSKCLEICKEALKLSCTSELLTLVACSQVHCSMLDPAELHVNMGLILDPMNGLALDLRAMLQEFIRKDYVGALEDLQRLKEHPTYKKPGLDEIIARVEYTMQARATTRKDAALRQARHPQADLEDVSQQRMVVRERAATVVKMYMDRADKLQQDWQQQHPDSKAGPANPDYAQAESNVKEEGCFSMDAAMELLTLAQQQLSEQVKAQGAQKAPQANGQVS